MTEETQITCQIDDHTHFLIPFHGKHMPLRLVFGNLFVQNKSSVVSRRHKKAGRNSFVYGFKIFNGLVSMVKL